MISPRVWRARPYLRGAITEAVVALGYAPLLTFHPGSQATGTKAYVRHIEAAARIARTANMSDNEAQCQQRLFRQLCAEPGAGAPDIFEAIGGHLGGLGKDDGRRWNVNRAADWWQPTCPCSPA